VCEIQAKIVFGLDDHIKQRRGAKIAARGIYRDPVRSSKSFFVKTSALRSAHRLGAPDDHASAGLVAQTPTDRDGG
jgi:hypothetical protein